jgi:hypothetical protein
MPGCSAVESGGVCVNVPYVLLSLLLTVVVVPHRADG